MRKLRILNRKKKQPTLYNRFNRPIMPPLGSRRHPKTKKRKTQQHKLQKPSNFTDKEMNEILTNEFIKNQGRLAPLEQESIKNTESK